MVPHPLPTATPLSIVDPRMATTTMAGGYCTQELEQAARQLLPRDIMAEIGIVDTTTVIEGLATHLASILGLAGDGERTQRRPRPANATRPHISQHISRGLATNGGGGTPAHLLPGSRKNGYMVPCPGTMKMFATPITATRSSADLLPERRQNGSGTGVFLPAATHHNGSCGGTGVFMPLAGAYRTRPFKSPSSKGLKPPRLMRKEAQWQ